MCSFQAATSLIVDYYIPVIASKVTDHRNPNHYRCEAFKPSPTIVVARPLGRGNPQSSSLRATKERGNLMKAPVTYQRVYYV